MNWKRRAWTCFGYVSTALLFGAAIDPGVVDIPLPWRPWLFLASIGWFYMFVTGFFTQ